MTTPLIEALADLLADLGITEDDDAPLAALAQVLVELDLDGDDLDATTDHRSGIEDKA